MTGAPLSSSTMSWISTTSVAVVEEILADLDLRATGLQVPAREPMPFSVNAVLRPQSDPGVTLATLALEGQASDAAATVDVDVGGLSLAALAPYVSLATTARIS